MPVSDITRVRAFYERGLSHLKDGKLVEACSCLKDAININPNFLPARTSMALALCQQHKYVDAIKLLEDGRKQTPLLPFQQLEVLMLLGNICLVRQDFRAASFYLKTAAKIDPGNSKIRLMLSVCECKAGHFNEGLDLLLANAKSQDVDRFEF